MPVSLQKDYRVSNVKSPATGCGALIRYRTEKTLLSNDADVFTVVRAFNFKFHFTVCFSKQSVVTTATYVVASVEFGATLTNNDATRQNGLATETLNAKAFSF